MKSLNIKHTKKTYTNVLKDINFLEAVVEWSINICKTDPLIIDEPIAEVMPLQDGSCEIKLTYTVLDPTWLQKIYYKYWVGISVESFAKTMRGN